MSSEFIHPQAYAALQRENDTYRAENARLREQRDELLDLTCSALVYVEEAPTDGYKRGAGPTVLSKQIRAAIERASK